LNGVHTTWKSWRLRTLLLFNVDWHMLMRFSGGGVGHKSKSTRSAIDQFLTE
jgi:hypothetical protein